MKITRAYIRSEGKTYIKAKSGGVLDVGMHEGSPVVYAIEGNDEIEILAVRDDNQFDAPNNAKYLGHLEFVCSGVPQDNGLDDYWTEVIHFIELSKVSCPIGEAPYHGGNE